MNLEPTGRRRIPDLHGTPSRYQQGCECSVCKAAMAAYSRRRYQAIKDGSWNGYGPADRVRAHLQNLKAHDISMSLLSRLTGLPCCQIKGFLIGHFSRIRADAEKALLRWTAGTCAGERKVHVKNARLHIQSLEQQGMSLAEIGQLSGINENQAASTRSQTNGLD